MCFKYNARKRNVWTPTRETSASGEPDDAVLSGRGDWFARGRSRLHPRNDKKSGDLEGPRGEKGWELGKKGRS
jgi:hypothetical protein